MDTLPIRKESGRAGKQGDTEQPQGSSQAYLQGWEGKEGKLLGGTRKENPGKGAEVLSERGPETPDGQEAERKGCSPTA